MRHGAWPPTRLRSGWHGAGVRMDELRFGPDSGGRKEKFKGVISCGRYTRRGVGTRILTSFSPHPRTPASHGALHGGWSDRGQTEDTGCPVTFSQLSVPMGASERLLHACCLLSVKRSALPVGSRRHSLCSRASGWAVGKVDRLWLSLRTCGGGLRASGQRQGASMVWQKGLWPRSEHL